MTMSVQVDLRMSNSQLIGHLTETTLLSIKNDVHLALTRGEATAVVLLDQSATFDTVDHGTLLNCLSPWFGVGGIVLE